MLSNSEKLKNGVDDAMGGHVLELESERLRILGKVEILYNEFNYSPEKIVEIVNKSIEDEEYKLTYEKVEEIIKSLKKEKK